MHNGNNLNKIFAGMVLSGAVFLVGCSNGEGDSMAEPSLQSTASQADDAATTVEATTTQSDSNNDGNRDGNKDQDRRGECSVDPGAQQIQDATAKANADYPNEHGGWVFKGDTNYDSCGDLTYARVEQTQQGNAQFGTLILMFHKGEYIGIDSTAPQQAMEITPKDGGSFTVLYKDWEALMESGAGNAEAPKYNSTVTYYWDGDKVAHEGRIPNTNL